MNLLLILGILVLSKSSVFHAEKSVFVQEGQSVQLDIQDKEIKISLLVWQFNSTQTVVHCFDKNVYVSGDFENRVEFNKKTFSLTLKDMEKIHGGLYTAKEIAGEEKIVAQYLITVLDPVVAPVLSVLSNWSSSDSCNVTLACRGHDLFVASSCNRRFCSEESVTSSQGSMLRLSVTDNSILCNHSNKVSWRVDAREIKLLCPFIKDAVTPPAGVPMYLLRTVLLSVTLVLMMSAVITVHIRERLIQSS
ncbi:uncharacterized protein LOC115811341 [Chanos chanos]|uniref:Uncharacterized protein LOC115811341 n=1 Tax=Chanos chanos TaxID=29144 RepID=A0A6J2V915_CHACN|nr:uncharacterized protein LOC115811341 [Chanos chanos]